MRIAVAREIDANEPRVAATPETVKKFKALGVDIVVARGAGIASGIADADFEAAGAAISNNPTQDADVVLKCAVRLRPNSPPTSAALSLLRSWILIATTPRLSRWRMPASSRSRWN